MRTLPSMSVAIASCTVAMFHTAPGAAQDRWPLSERRPERLEYTEGQAIPVGYHVERTRRPVLIGVGLGVFGGFYLPSAIAGGRGIAQDDDDGQRQGPLLIPVAGPFVTIATTGLRWNDGYWDRLGIVYLLADGVAQSVGVTLAIIGFAGRTSLVLGEGRQARQQDPSPAPEVLVRPGSGSLRWRF